MTTSTIQYRTIEQKRAALYTALTLHPEHTRLREVLATLTTPHQMRLAARDGIFVSYSRFDELFALDLSIDLRRQGLNVWLDMLDVSYRGDWKHEIEEALERCGLMLMITSAPALYDRDLQTERLRFMQKGKILLPVIHKNGRILAIPGIDFRQDYAAGLNALLKLLQTPAEASVS